MLNNNANRHAFSPDRAVGSAAAKEGGVSAAVQIDTLLSAGLPQSLGIVN